MKAQFTGKNKPFHIFTGKKLGHSRVTKIPFATLFLPTRRPTPEGRPLSWQIIEPYVSTEEKSHLSVRDFFLPYLGVSNTPYLGTDVTFMYVSLPLRGLGVVSADVSVSEIGGPFRGD